MATHAGTFVRGGWVCLTGSLVNLRVLALRIAIHYFLVTHITQCSNVHTDASLIWTPVGTVWDRPECPY